MKKREAEEERWETPSLEWIHQVRRERQRKRGKKPPRPMPRAQAEALAKKYGLKLTDPVPRAATRR